LEVEVRIMSEKEEKFRVEWGAVIKIILPQEKSAYLIYGPPCTETAYRVKERLEAEGFSVTMLNEGVDSDAERARKLVLQALQHDCDC
jgi:hypothetical protein